MPKFFGIEIPGDPYSAAFTFDLQIWYELPDVVYQDPFPLPAHRIGFQEYLRVPDQPFLGHVHVWYWFFLVSGDFHGVCLPTRVLIASLVISPITCRLLSRTGSADMA